MICSLWLAVVHYGVLCINKTLHVCVIHGRKYTEMDNQYKRMILLPETEFIELKQCRLNADRKEQLVWPADISSEREQKLYALSLAKQREADHTDPLPSSKPDHPTDKKMDFSPQIALLPSAYRVRAQRLYNILEKHRPNSISWKETGEVIFGRHESPLEGSHLLDLIQHATTNRRRQNFIPTGWSHFFQVLRNLNVPMSVLNDDTQREWQRHEQLAVEEAATPPRTPTRKRRTRGPVSASKKWIKVT